jgi:hypothetical protein
VTSCSHGSRSHASFIAPPRSGRFRALEKGDANGAAPETGLSEKEVAAELKLSPNTVHGYVKILYRKLDVANRSESFARFGRRRSLT